MPRVILNGNTFARITVELFTSGRRTVSYHDLLEKVDRQFDTQLTDRIIELLPDIQGMVERAGFPCTLVNDFCVRQFAQTPVHDIATAQRCTMMRSGGKPAVALRHALPDDLVRGEVPIVEANLHGHGFKHCALANANDVAEGLAAPETRDRLLRRMREDLTQSVEIQSTPIQPRLPE